MDASHNAASSYTEREVSSIQIKQRWIQAYILQFLNFVTNYIFRYKYNFFPCFTYVSDNCSFKKKMFYPLLFFKIIIVIVHVAIFIRLITELFQHFQSNI